MNLPLLDTLDCDIEQKNIQLDLENVLNLNHENIKICNEDIRHIKSEQNLSNDTNNFPAVTNASSTTCIYEPLSDDDIF